MPQDARKDEIGMGERFECPKCNDTFITLDALWWHEEHRHPPRSRADSIFDYNPIHPEHGPIFDSGFTNERRERYEAEGNKGEGAWEFAQWIYGNELDRAGRKPGEPEYKFPLPMIAVNKDRDKGFPNE